MMFYTALGFLLVALVGADSDYHDPNFSGNHGVIVHLFEWKWTDIALECERFLGPKGFGGVQVSPPNENLMVSSRDRPWWERYQPISYKLITRSGNEAEFEDMCKRCNAAGVRIYVDAIINHMTGTWVENVGTGGSLVTFADWNFPGVPYTKADFNQPICDIGTYQNATEVRNCQLQGLKDLNQGIPSVKTKIIDFMNHLLTLGVAGFRIDAAKHMWPEDLKVIYDSLRDLVTDQGFAPGTRPFIFQEVIDLGGEDVHREEYLGIGRVTEMRYGFNIGNLFRGNLELRKLINWGGPYVEPGGEWFFMDHKDVIVFVDNHDTQRGGLGGAPISYKMKTQYQAANAFMLAHPFGLPKVMSSFDFDNNELGPPSDSNFNTISPTINDDGSCGSGWVCEHRWPAITQMVIFRNTVRGGEVTNWWDNENNQIAFCVGKRGFAAFNNEGLVLSENLDTGMPAGTYCDVITGKRVGNDCSGKKVVVDGSGRASIEVSNDDMAMAFHVGPESNLGASETDTTSTSSTTTTTQKPGTNPEPGCGDGMQVKATYEGATWIGCIYSN